MSPIEFPRGPARCAVLLLSGSSGRLEPERAQLFADHGAAALSWRWFGDAGQPPEICEVPLESFTPVLDRLAGISENLAVLGTSKGAEAALLLAARDPRIRTVVAMSPTSVVWEAVGSTPRPRSSWSVDGMPVPFVPYDQTAFTTLGQPPAFRPVYERALPGDEAARIPVERIQGRVILSAGCDDQVWPSDRFAQEIEERRLRNGLQTTTIVSATAGHRVLFPGEPLAPGGRNMVRGGSVESDRELGHRVWEEIVPTLGLTSAVE